MTADELSQFDIVITTYQTVTGECPSGTNDAPAKKKKKLEKGLFDVQWKVGWELLCVFHLTT
jgi:SWI/SNF-related matrix-associated actin-dependent regulator of chromatin subfamily A3